MILFGRSLAQSGVRVANMNARADGCRNNDAIALTLRVHAKAINRSMRSLHVLMLT